MKPFKNIAGLRPKRSVFNLSHYKLFDYDLGWMVPILCKKMVPGDKFKIQNQILIRANPMVAPIMHGISIITRYFFVPFRILWPKPIYKRFNGEPVLQHSDYPNDTSSWEEFFTGGQDGKLEPEKPKWEPILRAEVPGGSDANYSGPGSLWDYFGFPVGILPSEEYRPDIFPLRAYNMVWNEYIRHPDYQEPVDLDRMSIRRVGWQKDYFTSAGYDTQRGIPPALPISGGVEFNGATTTAPVGPVNNWQIGFEGQYGSNYPVLSTSASASQQDWINATVDWLNNNSFSAQTFDVNDLRLVFQIQKYLERNMRGGGRYIEQLKAHYGVSPRDDRLQRPEYIGGTKDRLIVSEVLQTSATDNVTAQGNLAGHGISVQGNHVGTYYAQEFGVLLGVFYMRPDAVYQQGFEREWMGYTRYDELLPEFVNLGEQEVFTGEVYGSGNPVIDKEIFGFQGRYDEYRYSKNYVCGNLRTQAPQNLDHWHIARYFNSKPALNADFIQCAPRNDFLAVPSERGFIVQFGNILRAVRPLPIVGTPGLIDHH